MNDDEKMSLPLKILFCLVLVIGGVVYGFFSTQYRFFPANQLNEIRLAFLTVHEDIQRPWYLDKPVADVEVATYRPEDLAPGLVMVTGIGIDRYNFIRVVDREGNIVYSWKPDWFTTWPEVPDTILSKRKPQRNPGALAHGVGMLADGGIVMNFDLLSTVKYDACGDTVWKLDNFGHHSVDLGDDGTIFVSAERVIVEEDTGYPNHQPVLNSFAIQQLDADGNTLLYKEVLEILIENDLRGLMHMPVVENLYTNVSGDTMHMNDVEVFPSDMESEVFEPGDLMVSLRNINTIFVVDPDTWKIKFLSVGTVLRQHDPDFAPNDKIIVYDNRNEDPFVPKSQRYSRIVEIDARTGEHRTLFKGEGNAHFYSPRMGKQELLPNGNLLIASTIQGRVFEVNPAGELVWEYNNIVDEEHNGILTEAQLLPEFMDRAFFENLTAQCNN